jgi:hypothetical protein
MNDRKLIVREELKIRFSPFCEGGIENPFAAPHID